MGRATKVKAPKIGFEQAAAELASVEAKVKAAAERHAAEADKVGRQVAELMKPVHALGASLRLLRARQTMLRKIVDAGPAEEPTVREMVDNPHRSDGVVEVAIADGVEQAGRIAVDIRQASRIGGLARLGAHLSEARLAAAAKFRSAWDGAQLGGARAIDYSQTRVDVSASVGSSEAALALVEDALVAYRDAVKVLGPIKSILLQRVICDEMSLRDLGLKLGRPVGGKATIALRDEVLDAVDVLVRHFGTVPKATGRMRGDSGERLPLRREDGATVIVFADAADSGAVNSEAA